MNRITPRMFCTVGRYTPMIVPRLACRADTIASQGDFRERGRGVA